MVEGERDELQGMDGGGRDELQGMVEKAGNMTVRALGEGEVSGFMRTMHDREHRLETYVGEDRVEERTRLAAGS